MLIRTSPATAVALVAASLGSFVLAGCSTSNNGVVTHTPALKTIGGRNTARSAVQATILIADTTNGNALPGGPTPAGVMRRFLAAANGRRASATGSSTGVCNNGVKQSQVTNSDGSQTTTTDYYYDAACATLEAEEVITVTTPSTPGNTDGTGTITSYDSTGTTIRVVQKLGMHVVTTSGTTTTETFTLTDNASTTPGGTTVASFGSTCTGTPPSATLSCSVARYGVSAGTTFGESFATSATAGTSGGNANATSSIAFFAGPGLGVSQSGTTWSVTGAFAYNSATATYGYASTGPTGNGTLTLKDNLYTYAETATLSSTGLSIQIQQNPNSAFNTTTQIATATVDRAGTGTLSYSDGTSEKIGGLIGF